MRALSLHGADVGARADGCGAAHHVLFMRVLDQAHFIQHAAQVALLFGAQRAIAHARAHLVQPAAHARFQPRVDGKRVPHGVAVLHEFGQLCVQLAHGMGGVHTQRGGRGVGAQAKAVPDLALQVLGLAKQRAAPSPVITSQALGSVKPLR
jgi:hypothetical protein